MEQTNKCETKDKTQNYFFALLEFDFFRVQLKFASSRLYDR